MDLQLSRKSLFGITILVALVSTPALAQTPQLPTPPRWRQERIEFPLGFAPSLPYQGHEDLRFMPGMFKPAEKDYFSYAFVWWVEGRPAVSPASLERDLHAYFHGLMSAVGKDKGSEVKPESTKVKVRAAEPGYFVASVQTVDSFNAGRSLDLVLEVRVDARPDHTGYFFVVAPASAEPSVLGTLRELVARARSISKD